MVLKQFLFLFHMISISVDCARIIFIPSVPMYSHSEIQSALARELSLRGHHVVLVTSFPLKDPTLTNLTEIDVSYIRDFSKFEIKLTNSPSPMQLVSSLFEHTHELFQKMIEDNNFKKTIKTEQFDLLFIECTDISGYAFSYVFKSPVICMLPFSASYNNYASVGNVNLPLHYADTMYPIYSNSIFYQKIARFLYFLFYQYLYYYNFLPKCDNSMRKYIKDENMPFLGDLERNVSLMFLNVNPIMDEIHPYVPAIIDLRLLHLKPLKPLPQKLQKILDDSPEGVIYISFGTSIQLASQQKLIEVINKTVTELPYTILWKIENTVLRTTTKNVFIQDWFPQQDLLAHPNIKLFITHGGRQSLEEAIFYRIPIIIIPFFGDQLIHAHNMVKRGIAISLNHDEITETALKNAIEEVLTKPLYKKRITEVSKELVDQPMSGMEKAVWWTEYVLRHKGASHLRSPLLTISAYEFLMLDFLLYILIALFIGYCSKRLITY